MKLIKIDKNSITKNKDAGSTQTNVYLNIETEFEIKSSSLELLKYVSNIFDYYNNNIIFTSYTNNDDIITYNGIIKNGLHNELFELIKNYDKNPKITINSKANYNTITHPPIPKYNFKYENRDIHCESCGKDIVHTEIITEVSDFGDDYTICPNCNEINSFEEYSYETIKNIKL